ncbi:MAG: chemotaxis response regulator protein-glutamate methylesterase [Gammaproteobacteria bacterium]|nr:chemotaxis response regulator protein-glutamate methylesterase [Gammaproteobacteria bacterium]
MAIRVLIVDDSGFFRRRLTEIISSDRHLEVVGIAENGLQAIEQAKRLRPDVITMDIEMPEMDGITATRQIMAQLPTAILMLSTWTTEGAKATLDALEAGAVDFMPKRFSEISSDHDLAQQKLCLQLRYLATNFRKGITSRPSASPRSPEPKVANHIASTKIDKRLKLVAIGTSTGGPVALQEILTKLPANFPYPILLIQHMPATFTPSFAQRLNNQCAIKVKQAENGNVLVAGTAYLAPGGEQMLLKGTKRQLRIELQASKPEQTYRPCIDITLGSIAEICPADTLAIILTGMGSDGRDGCSKLKPLGASIWSQDENSSTIYGMPMAIAKAGLADKILSLTDIAKHLSELK